MRMQSSEANCGSTSLYNALYALGTRRTLEECEKICKTSATDGTNIFALIDAIATIRGCNPIVLNERSSSNLFKLRVYLLRGRAAVLCVDDNDHYIAAVGTLGARTLIADSASNELVESWTERQLIKHWEPDFWGVIL